MSGAAKIFFFFFLQNRDPRSTFPQREQHADLVVDRDELPFAFFEEAHGVLAAGQVTLGEQVLHEVAARRNDRQRRQEPTVAQQALLHVACRRAVHKQFDRCFRELFRTFPRLAGPTTIHKKRTASNEQRS